MADLDPKSDRWRDEDGPQEHHARERTVDVTYLDELYGKVGRMRRLHGALSDLLDAVSPRQRGDVVSPDEVPQSAVDKARGILEDESC